MTIRGRELLICLGVCVALAGCRREPATNSTADTFQTYAGLPALKTTHDAQLRDELAMLIAERATPRLLDEDAAATNPSAASVDLCEVLSEQFNRSSIQFAMRRSDKLFDEKGLRWDPVSLEHVRQIRQQYDKQRRSVRQVLLAGDVHLSLQHSLGVGMPIEFVDACRLYNRLELFHGALQLTANDPQRIPQAIQTLRTMFALSSTLSRPKHPVSRLAAADSRREAIYLMQAIVLEPATDPAQLEQVRQIVVAQLANWPDDAHAWIGDRAQGLHLYEMIRDGHLLSLLTEDELVRYRRDRTLDAFAAAAARSVDSDEYFYLRAMRSIIDACDRPFYEREDCFTKLRSDLSQQKATPHYPLIADRLLLQGIEAAQRAQALDRAWMEACALGLTLAQQSADSPAHPNPLSGRPYLIEYGQGTVTIGRIDPHDPHARFVAPLHRTDRVSHGGHLPPPR